MGKCVFCGENAGIFRDRHAECDPIPKIRRFVCHAIVSGEEVSDLRSWIAENIDAIEQVKQRPYSIDDIGKAVVEGWCDAVDRTLVYGVITDEEEERLSSFAGRFEDHFDFSSERMIRMMPRFKQCCASVDMAVAAKEVKRGNYCVDSILNIDKLRTPFNLKPHMPFNLQKSEKLVLVIPDVEYCEGVAYYTDTGLFGITTKHLYFSGRNKKFRIRYDRLVTYEYSHDRLTVMRDALSAKPQRFITGNGRITYELVDILISNIKLE